MDGVSREYFSRYSATLIVAKFIKPTITNRSCSSSQVFIFSVEPMKKRVRLRKFVLHRITESRISSKECILHEISIQVGTSSLPTFGVLEIRHVPVCSFFFSISTCSADKSPGFKTTIVGSSSNFSWSLSSPSEKDWRSRYDKWNHIMIMAGKL